MATIEYQKGLEEIEEAMGRLYFRKIETRSPSSFRWEWGFYRKDVPREKKELEPIRFGVTSPHRIYMPPKRFETPNGKKMDGKPYNVSIPLNLVSSVEDQLLVTLNDHLRNAIANHLFDTSIYSDEDRQRFFCGYDITREAFENPQFFKGFIGYWGDAGYSNCDFKAKFEYGFDKKPSFILADMTIPTAKRLIDPQYVQEKEGLKGNFGTNGFYCMAVKTTDPLTGQEQMMPMCGMTACVITAARYSVSQMDVLAPRDESGVDAELTKEAAALQVGGAWQSLSMFAE